MGVNRVLPVLALLLVLAGSTRCGAEDMRFVDSSGSTGYYVDLDSVARGEGPLLSARIAVIKADRNRAYRYSMQFNTEQATYRILSSQVLAYDTKEVLETGGQQDEERHYGSMSMMHEIVAYILHPELRGN